MPATINWAEAVQPLLEKYKGTPHPLEYKNTYQLVVMVILSAQDTDRKINKLAPKLFEEFSHMEMLAEATPESVFPFVSGVRNFRNKTKWLIEMAQAVKKDSNIPQTIDELDALPGLGRKSANVILRESGASPEGVIVDLHVVRVAPRLGIASGSDPKKIEKQIMEQLPRERWDSGMAMSFLGREICRPQPKCEICLMKPVCTYYQEVVKKDISR